MKTIEEVLAGYRCCFKLRDCNICPYFDLVQKAGCSAKLCKDIAAYLKTGEMKVINDSDGIIVIDLAKA